MRALLTVAGLLIVLGIVGLLAKKQMTAVAPAPAAGTASGTAPAPQQQVQQFQKNLEGALQQARPMPDETR